MNSFIHKAETGANMVNADVLQMFPTNFFQGRSCCSITLIFLIYNFMNFKRAKIWFHLLIQHKVEVKSALTGTLLLLFVLQLRLRLGSCGWGREQK